MSGGFNNAVVGGSGILKRKAVESPNFVTGVSGWIIREDGSAEFNNLNLRGTFTGTDWIFNQDGLFVYNGTPALGNLSLAITNPNASGTDGFGNSYAPGGISIVALAGLANLLSLQDTSGNTIFSVDTGGNVQAASVSADAIFDNGSDVINDLFNTLPQGVVNRGWAPNSAGEWPSTAIGTTETALLELDQVLLAGRAYRVTIVPADYLIKTAPAGVTQYVQRLRYTTDGSTPTTASTEVSGHSPIVQAIPVTNLVNYTAPAMEWTPPTPSVDTLYRFLVSSNIQSGAFKYETIIEMRVEDLGVDFGQFGNGAVILGTGGSGGSGGKTTVTKTYFATATDSYYGSQANVNPNGKRSHNSSCYQGAYSGGINVNGDQYSFISFNASQIASDLSGATINWVKLRLTCLHSWYNSGMTAIVGYGTAGSYGDPFVPGAGTHFNQTNYHINEGATLNKDITGAGIGTAFQSGGATAIAIGRSADKSTSTDLNNYGYFFGFSSTNHTNCPQLQINYTK